MGGGDGASSGRRICRKAWRASGGPTPTLSQRPGQPLHNRFGRGRGKGTGARSIAVLCTGRETGSDRTGARKDAIGSFDGVVRTGAFWMDPVSSSFAGACFPPLPIFSSANIPTTRITATPMLSRVRRPSVNQGTANRFRIGRAPPARDGRVQPLAPDGKRHPTDSRLTDY